MRISDWSSDVCSSDLRYGEGHTIDPRTVEDAADLYLKWFQHRKRSYAQTQNTIKTFILPQLGHIPVDTLTASKIREWHATLAQSPIRLRTRPERKSVV